MRHDFFSHLFHQERRTENHLAKESDDLLELQMDKEIVPLVWGRSRVRGRIIWNHGPVDSNPDIVAFAIGICEGPITSINNIYVNNQKKTFKEGEFCKYFGTLDQNKDPFMLQCLGDVPAYRGLAYVVFYQFSLKEFEGSIPQFSFDVSCLLFEHQERISKITAVNIIPGCGEFVYDTRLLYKKDRKQETEFSKDEEENKDQLPKSRINYWGQATESNSQISLEFLKQELPGVSWVAPVVCWFGDSLLIQDCNISPRVEYEEGIADVFDERGNLVEWKVANYSRADALRVGLTEDEIRYGGTVSDESVVSYLQLMRSKGYKIMFYPMLFIDEDLKPWRGHMRGDSNQVKDFFRKNGYNAFIEHYANLVKDYVDAFVIGSELEGITSIFSENAGTRIFPAVEELIQLAKNVKSIFAYRDIKVTYAANWSEYHSKEGWYHMDKLWMCDSIDFIGIDVYFPATNTHDSDITYKEIKDGYLKGDTYDYYNDNGSRKYCDPRFALKNVEYWWKNNHINPDGRDSGWIPQKKKVWFTEFGFASIDKSTNEPNVFFDANSKDGGVPKFSSGETDFAIQEEAICAFIDHFRLMPDMIEEMFLWCWDARYPAWPGSVSHSQTQDIQDLDTKTSSEDLECVWADSDNWKRGHWINGKLSCVSVQEILREIFLKSGFSKVVMNSNLEGLISGVQLNYETSTKSLLKTLRLLYQFDLWCSPEGVLHVISRRTVIDQAKSNAVPMLTFEDLRFSDNTPSAKFSEISDDFGLEMGFLSENEEICQDDEEDGVSFVNILGGVGCKVQIKLPFRMSVSRAHSVAGRIINSMRENTRLCTLQVPFFFETSPGQLIEFQLSKSRTVLMRIISVNFHYREKELICVEVPYESSSE